MLTLLGATYPEDEKKKRANVHLDKRLYAFYCVYLLSSPILRLIQAYVYKKQNNESDA